MTNDSNISAPSMDEQLRKYKVAMIQMEVKGGDKAWNMNHAESLLLKASENGAEIALLPECMDLGWTHPSSIELAEPIPDGIPCQRLMKIAKEKKMFICAGLTERFQGQVFNTAVLIDDQGELIIRHRKLNELDIGHPFYAQGDRLNVSKTKYGTIGLMVCADGFAKDKVLSRSLGYMGADIILSPSAWAVEANRDNQKHPYGQWWYDSYIPVAKEFSMYILGVSNVGWISDGPWKGKKCIGNSIAIDAGGNKLLTGPYGVDAETIIYADIALTNRPARGDSWQKYWDQ